MSAIQDMPPRSSTPEEQQRERKGGNKSELAELALLDSLGGPGAQDIQLSEVLLLGMALQQQFGIVLYGCVSRPKIKEYWLNNMLKFSAYCSSEK